MHSVIHEALRPWKLASFAIGLGLLLVGADYVEAPDWDYPISFIMATLTYLSAPWSVRVLRERRWRLLPLALFWFYFTVDGCYWLYWHYTQPAALVMRAANFYASACLYWLCGFIWLHDGPLRTLFRRAALQPPAPESWTLRQMFARLLSTAVLFWLAYVFYSLASGSERMTRTCQRIKPGMSVAQLMTFAGKHGLGPRRLTADTTLAYLAEARSFGRHACRVELAGGRVARSSYNFAD